jgi:hypothetical protein
MQPYRRHVRPNEETIKSESRVRAEGGQSERSRVGQRPRRSTAMDMPTATSSLVVVCWSAADVVFVWTLEASQLPCRLSRCLESSARPSLSNRAGSQRRLIGYRRTGSQVASTRASERLAWVRLRLCDAAKERRAHTATVEQKQQLALAPQTWHRARRLTAVASPYHLRSRGVAHGRTPPPSQRIAVEGQPRAHWPGMQ